MCERLEKACKDLIYLKETMENNNMQIQNDIKSIKVDIKALVQNDNNTRTDVLMMQNKLTVLTNSVDILVDKYKEDEHSEVETLKRKLNEKDMQIKLEETKKIELAEEKKKLEEGRRWQIKVAVFVAFLGFLFGLATIYIKTKG